MLLYNKKKYFFRGPPTMKSARNNPRNARTDNKKSAPGQRNATTSNRKTSDAKNPKLTANKAHSGMI